MSRTSDEVGRIGEKAAEKLLKQAGCRVVARNYRCPVGEADLVVLDGEELVFVEVKTRQEGDEADPEDQVNRHKQTKLRQIARYFIHNKRAEDRACRFDVVAVVLRPKEKPELRRYKDAF